MFPNSLLHEATEIESWYNIIPDLPFDIPKPKHAVEERNVEPDELAWLYSAECLKIEMLAQQYATENFIEIPKEIREKYRVYRPTPLMRAVNLENYLQTPAEIYIKREDLSPSGSHKFNTALAQAYYAAKQGVTTLVTDTGAGQWGQALAMACQEFGLKCIVFMIRKSYEEKPYRRYLMEMANAQVVSSPSNLTDTGRKLIEEDPSNVGSLGIGMSEAVELVRKNAEYRLALGCMSYYAVMHQSVIGLETRQQLEALDVRPDMLIGCVGGGSNFLGFVSPFVKNVLGGESLQLIACESASVPCLTQGTYEYDWADYGGLTTRIMMYTLGHKFIPPAIHAGGLRYHGKTPVLSKLVKEGIVRASAFSQNDVFEASKLFLQVEKVLPAPESGHAILGTIQEAIQAKQNREKKVIVACLTGQGLLDLQSYHNISNV